MAIKEAMLPEFDHEMATTRLLLERVPGDRADWKPHAKSMSLGGLAVHLAEIPMWVPAILHSEEFDTAPPDGPKYVSPAFRDTAQVLALFDSSVATARQAIVGSDDASYMVPWSLKTAGQVAFTMPRAGVMRTFLLNHLIHHRGQLSVYLRLLDVPLPSIYGPSADTGRF